MECIAHTSHYPLRRDSRHARSNIRTDAQTQAHAPADDGAAAGHRNVPAARDHDAPSLQRGYVSLDAALLRSLRQTRMFSQQDLADDCWRRNIQLSLTTIKRAEAGRAVRFRIARAFAQCFDLPVERIAQIHSQASPAEA